MTHSLVQAFGFELQFHHILTGLNLRQSVVLSSALGAVFFEQPPSHLASLHAEAPLFPAVGSQLYPQSH